MKINLKAIQPRSSEETASISDYCERVSKISLYILIFLLPIFFLPWTANVLEFNKQALLIILAFVSFFAWLLRVLISGKAKVNVSLVYIPVLLPLLAYLVSTLFSWWRYGSFWGWPQPVSESLASLIGLTLVYALVINVFKAKEIFSLAFTLVISSLLANVLRAFANFGSPHTAGKLCKRKFFQYIGGSLFSGDIRSRPDAFFNDDVGDGFQKSKPGYFRSFGLDGGFGLAGC